METKCKLLNSASVLFISSRKHGTARSENETLCAFVTDLGHRDRSTLLEWCFFKYQHLISDRILIVKTASPEIPHERRSLKLLKHLSAFPPSNPVYESLSETVFECYRPWVGFRRTVMQITYNCSSYKCGFQLTNELHVVFGIAKPMLGWHWGWTSILFG